jgi:N-acyl-D-amino-acid deacylase
MHRTINFAVAAIAMMMLPSSIAWADESASPEELRAAITKSIPLVEKGSAGSAKERTCFTCHSQAVPVVALAAVKHRGFSIDEDNFATQVQHTAKHLERGRKNFLKGKGQGGRVVSAGYALWALAAGGEKPNETTAAVTGYFLTWQSDKKHWSQGSQRPPTAGSDFTNTYLAMRGLAEFGTDEQKPEIEKRTKQVQQWLSETASKDTEDRVFRLRTMPHVDADEATIQGAIDQLIETQHDDGGWAQLADMESDAYATGTVLVALVQAGQLPPDHAAVQRGIRYLLDAQLEDGSWHVVTRAKGFQPYFETGFPHGKDQFISTAASAWSMLALVLVLPETE